MEVGSSSVNSQMVTLMVIFYKSLILIALKLINSLPWTAPPAPRVTGWSEGQPNCWPYRVKP
jgi:hypothetical protein